MDYNKILGLMVGAALGDALGAPYEFRHISTIQKKYTGKLDTPISFNNQYVGFRQAEIGQITDDTEMMLVLLDLITEQKGYYKTQAILDYMEWANNKTTFAMGLNTRRLFKGVKTFNGFLRRYRNIDFTEQQSNGALMRCAILAVLDDINYLLEDCTISNNNPICLETNRVYLTLVKRSLNGDKKKHILNDILTITQNETVNNVINEALNRKERNIIENKGWCLHGLYMAIYCFKHFNSHRKAINHTILCGGDTDTNACIVGALFGAYYGYDDINNESSDNIRILLNCDTCGGDFVRNEKYLICDIKNRVRKLCDALNIN